MDNNIEIYNNGINFNNTKKDYISNCFELIKLEQEIRMYEYELEKLSRTSNVDLNIIKENKIKLIRKISFAKEILQKGMAVNLDALKHIITNDIVEYLEVYGFSKELILSKLKNINFVLTNERLLSGGLLGTVDNKISIDYSLAIFDEQGRFIKFKDDKKNFIKYVLTHEFLHVCSISNKNISFKDDALSEGFTDLFAHIISKNKTDKSDNYDFLVRVCTLLANMMGINETLHDYIDDLGEFQNLKQLFYNQGLNDNDFKKFYILMNNILKFQLNNNSQLLFKREELLQIIKNNLLIPFIKSKEITQEYYINLFNNLFNEYGFSCSLEETKKIIK